MKIDLGHGATLEPDEGPRDSKWHKRILRTKRMPYTRTGHYAELECGHQVMMFGNLEMAGGVVLCERCRDEGQGVQ